MADNRNPVIGIDASRAFGDRQTGTERYARRIIEAMLDAGPDIRFRLYLNANVPGDIPMRAGTRQRLIPFPRLWTHARLSAELRLHSPAALFVPAHVVPLYHPAATVVTIHDLGYRYEPGAHTPAQRLYLEISTRWSARQARHVIAVSAATRDDLARLYGIASERVTVIHHGVDGRFFQVDDAQRDAARRALDLPQRYLLFVGTLQPRKNLGRLVEAFDQVAPDDPDLHLVLAGKRGWLFEQVAAAIARSRARDRIQHLDYVDDRYLPGLYAGAEAMVLPSLYEGFGLPVAEAMAAGSPVVVSDRGALPEVVGDAGIVVPAESVPAIAAGINAALDPATRERRVAAGRTQAGRFRWDDAGARTLAVVLAAMGAKRP